MSSLGYEKPVRTSQETHYISATEPSQLMLYKIRGFHGSDYEECLLGYKKPVRTSQETRYVSATESGQYMLFKIWGFHGGDNEDCCLPGYDYAVWFYVRTAIRRNIITSVFWRRHVPPKCQFLQGATPRYHTSKENILQETLSLWVGVDFLF
jgi:hypothetical protein